MITHSGPTLYEVTFGGEGIGGLKCFPKSVKMKGGSVHKVSYKVYKGPSINDVTSGLLNRPNPPPPPITIGHFWAYPPPPPQK